MSSNLVAMAYKYEAAAVKGSPPWPIESVAMLM
jgi:hypothetical protein